MQNAEWTETDTALWILNYALNRIWGFSSAGRAPALQAGGQRFDPANLHHKRLTETINESWVFHWVSYEIQNAPWKLNIESIMMQLWEQQLREN